MVNQLAPLCGGGVTFATSPRAEKDCTRLVREPGEKPKTTTA
jgi:hypothetical protein